MNSKFPISEGTVMTVKFVDSKGFDCTISGDVAESEDDHIICRAEQKDSISRFRVENKDGGSDRVIRLLTTEEFGRSIHTGSVVFVKVSNKIGLYEPPEVDADIDNQEIPEVVDKILNNSDNIVEPPEENTYINQDNIISDGNHIVKAEDPPQDSSTDEDEIAEQFGLSEE